MRHFSSDIFHQHCPLGLFSVNKNCRQLTAAAMGTWNTARQGHKHKLAASPAQKQLFVPARVQAHRRAAPQAQTQISLSTVSVIRLGPVPGSIKHHSGVTRQWSSFHALWNVNVNKSKTILSIQVSLLMWSVSSSLNPWGRKMFFFQKLFFFSLPAVRSRRAPQSVRSVGGKGGSRAGAKDRVGPEYYEMHRHTAVCG